MLLKKLLLVTALLLPSLAHAQWLQQPDGSFGYNFDYLTSGSFSCQNAQFYVNGATCNASSTSITFGSGTATATLSYVGTSGTALATNTRGTNYALGTMSVVYGGIGDFLWPDAIAGNHHIFDFALKVQEVGPIASSGLYQMGFFRASDTALSNQCCADFTTYVSLPVLPPPAANARYTAAVFDHLTRPDITVGGATQFAFTGQVGVVPEPSTWLLMAVGLVTLMVVGVARTKRT